jgi:ribokinase
MALDRLAREGIDITDFVELPLSKTGVAMIFQERKTASHAALVSNSANTDFSPALIKRVEPDIRESDLVFTQFEISTAALLEIYRICHHHKKHLVVHAAPVQPPVSFPKSSYYLLVADDFEAFLLAGYNNLDASIRELHEQGVQNVIIKRGHHSLIFSDGIACRVQPIPAASFVQDAGAVECLTAWAGIALANTGDLAYATYIGAQALAFSLSRHGAEDSMPYPSELSLGPAPSTFPQPHLLHRPDGIRH